VKQVRNRSSLISSSEYLGGILDEMNISPFLIPLMGIMVPITAIVGAFVYIIIKTLAKSRVRELEIRERIAMIERGLVPPPEVDPRGFDRAMDRYERYRYRAPGRHRRAGVTLMGVGFGLMLIIGVAGNSLSEGIGVGGFLVIMGLAFLINSLFDHPRDEYPPVPSRPAGTTGPITPEPPRRD
jgi:hypothetical protein